MKMRVSIMMGVALWLGISGQMSASEVDSPAIPSSVQAFVVSKKKESSVVGEKVNVVVEIFSETFFSGPTRFALPDVSGAVFYKPEERAVVSKEDSWSGEALVIELQKVRKLGKSHRSKPEPLPKLNPETPR